ncbi:MAG TPA: hypothetical protein DEP05_02740 [Betaproteobacteria bacterium]|nr:hypothetical protein [Betaproteobacteria bacterium]
MSEHVNVTLNPSEQIIAQANTEAVVDDENGRRITLKKPGVLAQYRLIEALGDAAKNDVYMGMVLPLIFVAAIDGDPVFQPASKREIEALIQRLDEAGVSAVMNGVSAHFGESDAEADQAALKK